MTILDNLHRNRQQAYDAAHAVAKLAHDEDRALTDAERSTFDEQSGEVDRFDQRIAEVAAQEARAASTDLRFSHLLGGELNAPKRGDNWLPSLREFRELQVEQRAVSTSGAFIPAAYSDTYFDLLRNRVSVLQAGPVILPLEGAHSVVVPRVTSAISVNGVPEAGTITPADPGLAGGTIIPAKFAAMTLVSSEALEDSRPELRQVVSNSLLNDMAVRLDSELLTGAGTATASIKGLRHIASPTAGPSTGTAGTALTFDILADTLAAAEGANLGENLHWIMAPRSWNSVRKLSDDNARPYVSVNPTASGVARTLWGYPVHITGQMPIDETVGASEDCSSLLLVDFAQVVVAVAREVELQLSSDFKFDSDQVALRVTCRYGMAVPHSEAVVLTTGVR